MIGRIVAQSDDVVVDAVVLHAVEEVCQHVALRGTLTMDDNLGVGTLFATGLTGFLQQIYETVPVGSRRVGVAAVGCCAICAPQHAIADLVACLDEIGSGTSSFQLTETVLGVFVNLVAQLFVVETLPCIGSPLFGGICPSVTIMEIKHELEACILDALAQFLHIV